MLTKKNSKTPGQKNQDSLRLVTITQFVSNRHLSKRYWVEDGNIEKTPLANMTKGTAERITVSFDDLPELLESADQFTAFGWGVCNQKKVDVVCTEYENLPKLKYGRNLSNFHYLQGQPGVMMIDYDHCDSAPRTYTPYELRDALYQVVPELKNSAYFVRGSISSGISLKGKKPKRKGYHFYVLVSDASKIPEFAKQLVKALWLAGHGYIKVSESGAALNRTCIDAAVFSPERLDLQGMPIYEKSKLDYKHQTCQIHNGKPFSCTPPIVDENEYLRLFEEAKNAKSDECQYKRETWISKQVQKLVDKGHSKEQAASVASQLVDSEFKELYPEFELDFGHDIVTVADVLKSPAKYNNKPLYDPIDGRKANHKSAVFWANLKTGKPVVHSRAHGVDVNYWLKKSWKQELADHVAKMNKSHCKVMYGGKAYIAVDTLNIRKHKKFAFELETELAKHNSHLKIQVGVTDKNKPIYKNLITAWATNPNVRVRGNVFFEPMKLVYNPNGGLFDSAERFVPNNDTKPTFNTWRGFTVKPFRDRTLLDKIRWHMRNVLCGDEEQYQFLCKWSAYTFQYPDKPATSVIVLKGERRIGKGLYGSFLLSFWGAHGLHISSKEYLTGRFNGHLADICYLFADEAFFAGDKDAEGRLKALVTERELNTERKFSDMKEGQNFLKILMATNNDWCIPATHDEDRYCVLDVANIMKGNRKYMEELVANLKERSVRQAFLEWMLSIDLTGFNPQDIPRNEALGEQIAQTFGPIQLWFQDCLVKGRFFYEDDGWDELLTVNRLHDSYIAWCEKHKRNQYDFAISHNAIGKYLSKIDGIKKANNTHGIRGRGYVFGTIEHAIQSFEAHEHVKVLQH